MAASDIARSEVQVEAADALVDRAFSRITGSQPVGGNRLRLLRDAKENYPVWLEAIAGARHTIHFENYIFADDEAGRPFAEALIDRARAGVRVRVLYDWFGCFVYSRSRFWRRLAAAGVEVRAFNQPSPIAPFHALSRNHRKVITVDGRISFVSGLCIARSWVGVPGKTEPWRDTGVALEGPAVFDVESAFAETWAESGPPLPLGEVEARGLPVETSGGRVRVLKGRPGQLNTYRSDQLVAAAATRTLWLTDAYFVATTAFVQALTTAARDGVDVRLLVPGTSDVPLMQSLVQTNYRPLLESGIRVFEWNGPMLHAKTAVADGRWCRIGSTNLNLTSWLTNWELDVTIDDPAFAADMEAMFLEDIEGATEVVLKAHSPTGLSETGRGKARTMKRQGGRLAAGAVGLGSTARAAITNTRQLSATETQVVAKIGLSLLAIAFIAFALPGILIYPVVISLAWLGIWLIVRAWRLRDAHEAREGAREAREG
ncbi:phospholipase D-like domain-containing protein [Marinivivus vitaminiproducens]|uniref:phospholipase D-like domain-containing protein n=1 Tax=Marinivivus vitaminiproducens TaxID=3035935 RepID=UPI0027A141A5|nr:phospholipase D-like domain-containing protein [Geminicoccaceae bacterium SCSIO 64248]